MRPTKERKPQGRRRHWLGALALVVGVAALAASWQAPNLSPPSLPELGLALTLAIAAGLLGRAWWHRSPYSLPIRLPGRLSTPARLSWHQRPFLGWTEGWLGGPRWAMGNEEDSAGVVGPPRVSKTHGSGIPQILLWGGPLVSLAPKPEVFRRTARRRLRLAQQHAGSVYIYAPTEGGRVEGMTPIRFSPASSRDPGEIKLRVASWVEAAGTAKHLEDADHWRTGASRILRGLFLAAAHHAVRPGDFTLVADWIAGALADTNQEPPLDEPLAILRGLHTYAGDQWAKSLEGIKHTASKERAGFFSAAATTIEATSHPNVMRSTVATDFDAEQFILSRSTLYVVSPTEHQKAIAPLLSMLVEMIVHTAYRLHREGRLEARLGVSLDDLANVAPLPQLESVISQGGGQGVNVFWNLQSLAQLRDHFGTEAAEAIWSATRCKVVFGGLSDEHSLARLSGVIAEERVRIRAESIAHDGKRQRTVQESYRPLLSAAQLREIPDRWALLLYLNERPRVVRQPLAFKCRQFAPAMVPWKAPNVAIEPVPTPKPETAPAVES